MSKIKGQEYTTIIYDDLEVDFSDLRKQLAIIYQIPEWRLFGQYDPNNDPRDWIFVYNRFIERK